MQAGQAMQQYETQQCQQVLNQLMAHQHSWPFSSPVDPVALQIPDYFAIISHPMDLGTIKSKLNQGLYAHVDDFAWDVRLVWNNARVYNTPNSDIHHMAQNLSDVFEDLFKQIRTALEERTWILQN